MLICYCYNVPQPFQKEEEEEKYEVKSGLADTQIKLFDVRNLFIVSLIYRYFLYFKK